MIIVKHTFTPTTATTEKIYLFSEITKKNI